MCLPPKPVETRVSSSKLAQARARARDRRVQCERERERDRELTESEREERATLRQGVRTRHNGNNILSPVASEQDYYHCGFKCEKFCGAGVPMGQAPLNCTVRIPPPAPRNVCANRVSNLTAVSPPSSSSATARPSQARGARSEQPRVGRLTRCVSPLLTRSLPLWRRVLSSPRPTPARST
jgi:hypothetical protein